jgi:glucans biosynthesis protein C
MGGAISNAAESTPVSVPVRYHYLDWLRVLAMLSIFFYHSDRFFNYGGWHVKSAVTNLVSTIHIKFFGLWIMPLFFIISGASVYYALKSRRAGGFIKERATRILIPLVLMGIFVLAPPQIFLERYTNGQFTGSFFQFYPHFFDGVYPFGGNFAFHGMHLWYLMDLFVFSMILLPFFYPSKKSGHSILSRLSKIFANPFGLFLLFVPLSAAALWADKMGMGITRMMGGWDMLSYVVFFVCGYLIFANRQIQDLIVRLCPAYLTAALVLTVTYLYLLLGVELPKTGPVWLGMTVVRSLIAWCWIVSIIGFGRRFLNFDNSFLKYANEAVLPFYMLHQTIILIAGFFILQISIATAGQFVIIASISFVAIMAIYELLIRRINILRFLFGMRSKKAGMKQRKSEASAIRQIPQSNQA